MLAGFWARKSDGHPGAKTMARGLVILAGVVSTVKMLSPEAYKELIDPNRPREPE